MTNKLKFRTYSPTNTPSPLRGCTISILSNPMPRLLSLEMIPYAVRHRASAQISLLRSSTNPLLHTLAILLPPPQAIQISSNTAKLHKLNSLRSSNTTPSIISSRPRSVTPLLSKDRDTSTLPLMISLTSSPDPPPPHLSLKLPFSFASQLHLLSLLPLPI